MNIDGTHGTSDTTPAVPPVPRPAAPPPPMPHRPPTGALETWLRTPRHADAPGIYAYGHHPRPAQDPARLPDRKLLGGAALSLLCGLLVWSLIWNGYLPVVELAVWIVPSSWTTGGGNRYLAGLFGVVVWIVIVFAIVWPVSRFGRWREVLRRYVLPLVRAAKEPVAASGAVEAGAVDDPLEWPEVRAAGGVAVAERLAQEARAGRMNDVDYVRLHRAWRMARGSADRAEAFGEAVLRHGAAAWTHPSGARDVPDRSARHDLYTAQVRIGAADEGDRNPYQYRGAGMALDPALLGTSLLAVGPPGSGKTRHLVRPVVESLCLQALAGTAAVIVVGPAGADLGPADAFDVVISIGDPASAYDLDLYGGATDPDEAAGLLAAALLDGFDSEQSDPRRASTALAQVLGPFRAAHGRFPSVPELRELLDGGAAAVAALRERLDEAGQPGWARELDSRSRQSGRPGDVGALLADRVALLDRPAFAGFFDVSGRTKPFALSALEHPLRVRVDLPERGHTEASRMLTRLLLAQFTVAVTGRRDRALFACLVLDDATRAVTADAVRSLQRLRSAHAGAVLALRGLDDVPEALRGALLGAAGCRIALSGVSTWDGKRFAESWGTTWVEEEDITRTPDQSGGLFKRFVRGVRRLFTGEAATTESVTVRRVERERWSASDLANAVPPGHAVASLTTVGGETAPPVLIDLRG
ncbi:ATP-binding protein [Streptomyces sp. SL13]|uniref:ATP-binding protein n=1 Tax=Streptantibioticus silvisoli TaxID=2705255 RepID=A0AA90KIC2_9ACTN|nr:ATP-binding protein [Streptantibioticus silvisoli]MDI5972915.1 ATP-binding protein [Streptantibioticus silvisoli]